MADRPTREECIRWARNIRDKYSRLSHQAQVFMELEQRDMELAEATIHYLTEGATPDMFAVEEHCVHCGYVAASCRCADFAERSVLKKVKE